MLTFLRRRRATVDDNHDGEVDGDKKSSQSASISGERYAAAKKSCLAPDIVRDAMQRSKKRVHWAETLTVDEYYRFSSEEEQEEDEDEDEEDDNEVGDNVNDDSKDEEESEDCSRDGDKKTPSPIRSIIDSESLTIDSVQSIRRQIDGDEVYRLKSKVNDMDRDLVAKTSLIDRLQKELKEAYSETEVSRERLKSMETEVDRYRRRSEELEILTRGSSEEARDSRTQPPDVSTSSVSINESRKAESASPVIDVTANLPQQPNADSSSGEETEEESEEDNDDEEDDEDEDEEDDESEESEADELVAEADAVSVGNAEKVATTVDAEVQVSDETAANRLAEAERQIIELERQLAEVIREREIIEASIVTLQRDREEDITNIQRAFEETIREQEDMINKFSHDFEELRTLNTTREQQLLEDFEWKLREVEKGCKQRIEKREKDREQLILELTEKLSNAEEQIKDLPRLKAIESEIDQTRASNVELKRNLRTVTRKLEEIQVSEKVLQEETTRLRGTLDKEKSYAVNLQMVHREELDERERKLNFKLNVQKTQLTTVWEDKLKRELAKVKDELEVKFRVEKQAAAETAKQLKDKEIKELKQQWDKRISNLLNQIEELEKQLLVKENENRTDLENAQTRSDLEILELRRKMDKLYMNCEDRVEKLQEQHEQQIGKLTEESNRRVAAAEVNLQVQLASVRTSLEKARDKLYEENQQRLRQMETFHLRQLEEQEKRLRKEKEEAIASLEDRHRSSMRQLQMEFNALSRCIGSSKQAATQLQRSSSTNDSTANQPPVPVARRKSPPDPVHSAPSSSNTTKETYGDDDLLESREYDLSEQDKEQPIKIASQPVIADENQHSPRKNKLEFWSTLTAIPGMLLNKFVIQNDLTTDAKNPDTSYISSRLDTEINTNQYDSNFEAPKNGLIYDKTYCSGSVPLSENEDTSIIVDQDDQPDIKSAKNAIVYNSSRIETGSSNEISVSSKNNDLICQVLDEMQDSVQLNEFSSEALDNISKRDPPIDIETMQDFFLNSEPNEIYSERHNSMESDKNTVIYCTPNASHKELNTNVICNRDVSMNNTTNDITTYQEVANNSTPNESHRELHNNLPSNKYVFINNKPNESDSELHKNMANKRGVKLNNDSNNMTSKKDLDLDSLLNESHSEFHKNMTNKRNSPMNSVPNESYDDSLQNFHEITMNTALNITDKEIKYKTESSINISDANREKILLQNINDETQTAEKIKDSLSDNVAESPKYDSSDPVDSSLHDQNKILEECSEVCEKEDSLILSCEEGNDKKNLSVNDNNEPMNSKLSIYLTPASDRYLQEQGKAAIKTLGNESEKQVKDNQSEKQQISNSDQRQQQKTQTKHQQTNRNRRSKKSRGKRR